VTFASLTDTKGCSVNHLFPPTSSLSKSQTIELASAHAKRTKNELKLNFYEKFIKSLELFKNNNTDIEYNSIFAGGQGNALGLI
jgi:hypothetical protein